MSTTVFTKESCLFCGRPNEEYDHTVASSSFNGFYVTWMADRNALKHVIFFDLGDVRGEEVFTDHNEAAARYHDLVISLNN